MRRPASDDTPAYAIEAAASAHFNGRHLGAASGLFVALLVAMSLVEAPLSHSQGYPRLPVHELTRGPALRLLEGPTHPSRRLAPQPRARHWPAIHPACRGARPTGLPRVAVAQRIDHEREGG